jgi:hypothetical protein
MNSPLTTAWDLSINGFRWINASPRCRHDVYFNGKTRTYAQREKDTGYTVYWEE